MEKIMTKSVILSLCCLSLLGYCALTVNAFSIEIAIPGYFGVTSMATFTHLGPAFETGLESLRKTYPELNISHTYLTRRYFTTNTYVDDVQDMLGKWFYQQRRSTNLTIIFTPGSNFEMPALIALTTSWNVLFVSSMGISSIWNEANRTKTNTYITTSTYPTDGGVYLGSLLSHLNWTSIYSVTDTGAVISYTFISAQVYAALRKANLDLRAFAYNSTKQKPDYRAILTSFRRSSRIMAFFGTPAELRTILVEASKMNMTNGEYAYLTVTAFDSKLYDNFTWYTGTDNETDEVVRQAYRSVLNVHWMEFPNTTLASAREMIPEWRRRSIQSYNNTNGTRELALPFLISTHQAFEVIGKVVTECLQKRSFDFKDGISITKQFLRRSFNLSTGSLVINKYGSRVVHVGFRRFGSSSNRFYTFLLSDEEREKITWSQTSGIRWFGSDKLPPNEPFCGFMNDNPLCHPEGFSISVTAGMAAGLVLLVVSLLAVYPSIWYSRHINAIVLQMYLLNEADIRPRSIKSRSLQTPLYSGNGSSCGRFRFDFPSQVHKFG